MELLSTVPIVQSLFKGVRVSEGDARVGGIKRLFPKLISRLALSLHSGDWTPSHESLLVHEPGLAHPDVSIKVP